MEFSEAGSEWRGVPEWAFFLIEFGFAWLAEPHPSRRIALVSMPCDSAAAGLIALGAMRRCLEFDDANDAGSHYQRLQELAHRHPKSLVLHHATEKGRFEFCRLDPAGYLWVQKLESKPDQTT